MRRCNSEPSLPTADPWFQEEDLEVACYRPPDIASSPGFWPFFRRALNKRARRGVGFCLLFRCFSVGLLDVGRVAMVGCMVS